MAKGKKWDDCTRVAVWALYKMVGARPPGGRKNLLIRKISDACGISVHSVYTKLFNIAYRDPSSLVRGSLEPIIGLDGGNEAELRRLMFMEKEHPEEYKSLLDECRRRRGLHGVI